MGLESQLTRKGKTMAIVCGGIDLAKNVFAIHGMGEHGKPVLLQRAESNEMPSRYGGAVRGVLRGHSLLAGSCQREPSVEDRPLPNC
jgi:hypothetical protein